jgi:DNA-directed RNA polymerase II subunit RPB3
VAPANFLNLEERDTTHDAGISIVKMGPTGADFESDRCGKDGDFEGKWCQMAVATYKFQPIITINEDACTTLTQDQKQQLVDVCPDRILEIHEVSGKLVVGEYASETATYTEDLMVLQDTMKKKEEEDSVMVEHSDNEYIFAI